MKTATAVVMFGPEADCQDILAGRDIPADRQIPLGRNWNLVDAGQFLFFRGSSITSAHSFPIVSESSKGKQPEPQSDRPCARRHPRTQVRFTALDLCAKIRSEKPYVMPFRALQNMFASHRETLKAQSRSTGLKDRHQIQDLKPIELTKRKN